MFIEIDFPLGIVSGRRGEARLHTYAKERDQGRGVGNEDRCGHDILYCICIQYKGASTYHQVSLSKFDDWSFIVIPGYNIKEFPGCLSVC